MRFGKTIHWAILATSLLAVACSSGSSDPGVAGGAISSVVQDLGADPSGQTTVITLPSAPSGPLTPGMFEADGTQLADSVSVVGSQATVTWDERVSPSDQVRAVGVPGVASDFVSVATSDSSSPTFTVGAGTQTPGLGGDAFTIQFTGPRVIEAEAEDLACWTIRQDGLVQDLTGSTFDYDPLTGLVAVSLGTGANLHASFEVQASGMHSVADVAVSGSAVSGTASGDSSAPSLVSAEQNIAEDELGRTVDFTFDEAMDPISSAYLSNFTTTLPVFAISVEQPSETVLRVTFTEPMIPTVDDVTLSGLEDAHGNDLVGGLVPVAQGSTVANGFASNPEVRTVENSLNDLVAVVFTQAIDPEDAVDHTHWTLDVDSTPVDLSGAAFAYDLSAKSLTITLDEDFVNGDSFDLAPASGDEPLDVDGELFTTSFSGTVTGDGDAPVVVSAVQNRIVAGDGTVVDVTLDEDVEQASSELVGNWSVTGGASLQSATRMADLRTVRLEFDTAVVPGDMTLGASAVADIAGNAMAPAAGITVLSNDTLLPTPTLPVAEAVEGFGGDWVRVTFNDEMIATEVEDPLRWTVESPLGSGLDTSGATVSYDAVSREATLTFPSGIELPVRESWSLQLSTMRDLGGNTVSSQTLFGSVTGDVSFPVAEVAWVDGVDPNKVHVRLSEPCAELADAYDPVINPLGMTHYELFDGLGSSEGFPSAAIAGGDSLQVELDFGTAVIAGTHTLNMRGMIDLAGNQLFPVADMPILIEDPAAPILELGVSAALTVSGETNDVVTVVFDRDMSPWEITDPSHYDLELSSVDVDLSKARMVFDGSRTVTMHLDPLGAEDLETGGTYDLSVTGLTSAQGVSISGSTSEAIVAAGDSAVPTLDAGRVRIDAADPLASILIEMSEAVRSEDAADETAIDIGAVNPTASYGVGRRTTRATWGGGVSVGQTVNVSFHDLAGNLGLASQLIVGQDVAGPVVTAVSGVVTPGAGGDQIRITFDKPVQTGLALNTSRYTADQAGAAVDLSSAAARYESSTNTVVLNLPEGVDLEDGVDVHVTGSGVTDLAGLAMSPADISGATAGDAVVPTLDVAYVNHRADFLGKTVDVRFSEDVQTLGAMFQTNWSSSGGQSLLGISALSDSVYRLTFAVGFAPGDQLTVRNIVDLAGNAAGDLVVDVTL